MNNIEETILVGIFIRLSTDAIIRVIDYGSEIKEKLLTSFLMKFNKKSRRKQDPNNLFNPNTRMVLNDNNEYVFRLKERRMDLICLLLTGLILSDFLKAERERLDPLYSQFYEADRISLCWWW